MQTSTGNPMLSNPQLADRVSHVPQLYEHSGKSTAALLADAGYLEAPHTLTVDAVEDVLRREPQLAKLWLRRGRDQRIAGGWGIERENGEFRVRSYAGGKDLLVQDRLRACAEFIVRYVSFIGDALAH